MSKPQIYNLSWDYSGASRGTSATAARNNTSTIRLPEKIEAIILYPALGTPEIHCGLTEDIEVILLTRSAWSTDRMRERVLDQLKISSGLDPAKAGAARPLFVGPYGELACEKDPSKRTVKVGKLPFGPRGQLETESSRFAGYLDPRAFEMFEQAGYKTAYRVSISCTCLFTFDGGNRLGRQGEPQDRIIEKILDNRHKALRSPTGYLAYSVGDGDIDFTSDDQSAPIQSWHPVFHYAEGDMSYANFGHISDIHIAARQQVLARSRARVIDYWDESGESDHDVSPNIGERVNICSENMMDVLTQLGNGAADVLLVGGDLVDFLRSCPLTPQMIGRLSDGRPSAVWREVGLGPDYDARYCDCVDLIGFYGALLSFCRGYSKPAFLISGNHDCYSLPYGLSPRIDLLKVHELRANEGIPADHNLTFYEAILTFGETYRKIVGGCKSPFNAEMFDWFYSVFTPFDDYMAELPNQVLLGFGWGSEEELLDVPGTGHGIFGHLPRSPESVSSDQLALLNMATGKGKKITLLSHFTFVSYDDKIPMENAYRDGNEGDVYFSIIKDYNEHNLGTFEGHRPDMLETHCGLARDIQVVLTGHSHRRGLYLVDRVDYTGRNSLKIRYFDFSDFAVARTEYANKLEPAIIVSDSCGSIPRYNMSGEFNGRGSDPPSGTLIEFGADGKLSGVTAVRADCSPRIAVAMDYLSIQEKTPVVVWFKSRPVSVRDAETSGLNSLDFDLALNDQLTARGFWIIGVHMYWKLRPNFRWMRAVLTETARNRFAMNSEDTNYFRNVGPAVNKQRGNFVALQFYRPPGYDRYNCDDWWCFEFQVVTEYGEGFWKPKTVSYEIGRNLERAEKPDFDWRRTFVPHKCA